MEKYKLLGGQTLSEDEYHKYQKLMNDQGLYVVRWQTDKEFAEAIKESQTKNKK